MKIWNVGLETVDGIKVGAIVETPDNENADDAVARARRTASFRFLKFKPGCMFQRRDEVEAYNSHFDSVYKPNVHVVLGLPRS
jgi:hypothetical protein